MPEPESAIKAGLDKAGRRNQAWPNGAFRETDPGLKYIGCLPTLNCL